MVAATLRLERAARKWRELAERRHAHFVELYHSGRWAHYYTDQEFAQAIRGAFLLAQRWAEIVQRIEESRQPTAMPPRAKAA